MAFEVCCGNPRLEQLHIPHEIVPYSYGEDIDRLLKILMLYAPNIDSKQSSKYSLVSDKNIDDSVFCAVLSSCGIDYNKDVLMYGSSDVIPETVWNNYRNERVCTACQKVIMCCYAKQSKLENMLRCLRNCLAHGDFDVASGYLVGFNENGGKPKAFIRVDCKRFVDALESLTGFLSTSSLKHSLNGGLEFVFSSAFNRLGYTVESSSTRSLHSLMDYPACDLAVTKEGRSYLVEIKSMSGNDWLQKETVQKNLERAESNPEYMFVIMTRARIGKSLRKELDALPNLHLIGKTETELFLEGTDVLVDVCGN